MSDEKRPGSSLATCDPVYDPAVMAFYQQALTALEYAEKRIIKGTDDMTLAGDDLIIIRRLRKTMDSRRKDYLMPFQDHVKEVNDAYKSLMAPVEAADKITGDKMLAFNAEQDRIRAEQERINSLRMEAAKADAALHNGELTESVNLVEVLPPVATKTQSELGSTGQRDNWQFEITDFSLLPDEYKMPDAVKLGKVVRAGLHTIPGVRVFNQPSLVVRR